MPRLIDDFTFQFEESKLHWMRCSPRSALRHSIVIPNATHNDLGDYQQYLKIVRDFLADDR